MVGEIIILQLLAWWTACKAIDIPLTFSSLIPCNFIIISKIQKIYFFYNLMFLMSELVVRDLLSL